MKEYFEKISRYIPPENPGYIFIKRAKVFIPYKEIGLTILERTETALPLIFETVLKLTSLGIRNVEEMSELLGIEYDVYKEIISEMAVADYITVSEMELELAQKGESALTELTRTEITKNQINEIYVNLITGEIQKPHDFFILPVPEWGNMFLDQNIEVTTEYLKDNFESVKHIYDLYQIEVIDGEVFEKKSLHRILGVEYEKLRYLPMFAWVFINEDTSSLLLIFNNDDSLIYSKTSNSQISNNQPGALLLFDNPNECKNIKSITDIDLIKQENLLKIERAVKQKYKDATELESLYYSDRYLLDNELDDFIINIRKFKPRKILIYSCRLRKLLENNTFKSVIGAQKDVDILISYIENEYKIDESIKRFNSSLDVKIRFVKTKRENRKDETIIIASSGFIIRTKYICYETDSKNYLLKELSDISFNLDAIMKSEKELSDYIDMYKLE